MTEKTTIQDGAKLYASEKDRARPNRKMSAGMAKGRDLYNTKPGKPSHLEQQQGNDE